MLSRLRKAVPDIHSRYSLPATSSVRPAKLTSWPILDSSSLPKTYHHYSVLYRLLFNRPLGSPECQSVGPSPPYFAKLGSPAISTPATLRLLRHNGHHEAANRNWDATAPGSLYAPTGLAHRG